MDVAKGWLPIAAAGLLVTSLGGCVVNPYVASTAAPMQLSGSPLCTAWRARALMPSDAENYATCMRRVMENKAGRYATMNNGGGAALLGIGGLAAYRGLRGGNQANIAALTTGGAAMYGVQQYLYRNPREAIYWSGANALGCAITMTQKRLVVADEFEPLDSLWKDHVVRSAAAVGNAMALQSASRSGCADHAVMARADAALAHAVELDRRKISLQQRLARLHVSAKTARIDLIGATDAITSTVNNQLALQQPNPAELGALLAKLKLPGVQSPAAVTAPGDQGKNEKGNGGDGMKAFNGGVQPACSSAYVSAVFALEGSVMLLARDLDALESGLSSVEPMIGSQADGQQALKACYNPPQLALVPFALELPQPGVQKIKNGESLQIPVTGGTAPYAALATSRADDVTVSQVVVDGEPALKVAVKAKAAAGVVSLLAMDAVGTTRLFQVQIE